MNSCKERVLSYVSKNRHLCQYTLLLATLPAILQNVVCLILTNHYKKQLDSL